MAILHARAGCEERAYALALGLCWGRFRARHHYRGDALAYSTTVIDSLFAEGATWPEILGAGAEAFGLCLAGLVRVDPDAGPFSSAQSGLDGPSSEPSSS